MPEKEKKKGNVSRKGSIKRERKRVFPYVFQNRQLSVSITDFSALAYLYSIFQANASQLFPNALDRMSISKLNVP